MMAIRSGRMNPVRNIYKFWFEIQRGGVALCGHGRFLEETCSKCGDKVPGYNSLQAKAQKERVRAARARNLGRAV